MEDVDRVASTKERYEKKPKDAHTANQDEIEA
jgi:hypothetical protein